MIGITSYGANIPRLRLTRMAIFQSMGWFAPAIMAVAQGEKAVCNWDEDALSMAVEASRDCLVGMKKENIDALYLCSTTLPYADRQNAGIVSTALNLRDDILTADFTSSLKAGTSAMVTAFDVIQSGEKKSIMVTASDHRETKGAYFYEMWFGDGAASLLLGDKDVIAEFKGAYSVSYDFADHYRGTGHKFDYMWEERWVRDEGYSKIIPEAINGLLKKCNVSIDSFAKVVYPCFFKREHIGIAKKLGIPPDKLQDNMHEVCGETGTAHPLLMFVAALEEAKPGDKILLASFGNGCDAMYFEVTDKIKKLKEHKGVKGSLAIRKELDNYQKYAKFRDLVKVEMGIRAEAGGQSAITVLWRKRKMITGLVGGKCKKCGTPQFPKPEICVKPDCGAVGEMEDYEFSARDGKVVAYTGDMLAVSQEPPAVYGIVQFEGGGRMLADFTDCELTEVKVGQPIRMSFRKRYYDEDRGFHAYFWKAVPQAQA
ncbi:MAG: hydroxymethylglutaryl-CoA synthase family protein [Deltaproteobacteria bacterium]|nr:MAG: hydroxymethylglutaryl-CoA synthase family protein [Deltaproteobacteria bacterium]